MARIVIAICLVALWSQTLAQPSPPVPTQAPSPPTFTKAPPAPGGLTYDPSKYIDLC